jgi:hypothetical protein
MQARVWSNAARAAALGLGLWLQAAGPVAAQALPGGSVDGLAVTAILHQHCLKCHAGKDAPGNLRLVDANQLLKARGLIHPGQPGASVLIDLVKGGSMPPGTAPRVPSQDVSVLEEWVRQGAPALPRPQEGDYVLWHILRDWQSLDDQKRPKVRYIVLNHLLDETGASKSLKDGQDKLNEVLGQLRAQRPGDKGQAVLHAVDALHSVFRIDLESLGWDRRPYKDASWNLFDLALLEYPHGELMTDFPHFAKVQRLLETLGQVRPVPYVRGDWLAEALAAGPLHEDFLHLLAQDPRDRGRGPAGDVRPGYDGRRNALLQKTHQHKLIIPPLDALRPSDIEDPLLKVDVRVIPAGERKNPNPKRVEDVYHGDKVDFWVKVSEDAVIEVITIDEEGVINQFQPQLLARDKPLLITEDEPLPCWEVPGAQLPFQLIVFAYPSRALGPGPLAAFPKGQPLRAAGVRSRVVHPLYQLQQDDGKWVWKAPDPSRMSRTSVSFTTLPKKKP